MTDVKRLYDLAYQFRNAKIWTKLRENEVFAVDSPEGILYCHVMGRGGEHRALSVYIGEEAFASSFWRFFGDPPASLADILVQDCIQCSIEKKDQLTEEELESLREYCDGTGTPFRSPFPQFSRYYPHCVPWILEKDSDREALCAALEVVALMSATILEKGKDALMLCPIETENDAPEQIGLTGDPAGDAPEAVKIPLYSIRNGALKIAMTDLPPERERTYASPERFDEKKLARLAGKKPSGVLECEIIRLPEPVEGEPPYLPAVLLSVQATDGMMLDPVPLIGPEIDPDETADAFADMLLQEDVCPRRIRLRTAETRAILEPFCREAKIWTDVTDNLPALDEAVKYMMEQNERYGDEDDDGDLAADIGELVDMFSRMTVSEIRSLPDYLLRDLVFRSDLLPPDIIAKVKKALR